MLQPFFKLPLIDFLFSDDETSDGVAMLIGDVPVDCHTL